MNGGRSPPPRSELLFCHPPQTPYNARLAATRVARFRARRPGLAGVCMIISLNWLKDFVDIPADIDPRELALQFTVTTAEVEGVEHVMPNFAGLVAARIDAIGPVEGEKKLQAVTLTADRSYETLSSAPDLTVGDLVLFAPPGATVAEHEVGTTDPKGRKAEGIIVAGQGIGLVQVGANAIFLPPEYEPGAVINPDLFEDWLIEIDNKSVTHRPDCWGHYGIAREMAAMLKLPLETYPITPLDQLHNTKPEIAIEIDDPMLCARFSALLMTGLKPQPAPLEMQIRLAHCGMRPIDLLVDLTNYIMLELGQPMHAYDGAKVPNFQIAVAEAGTNFTTLDDIERTLPEGTLMIQTNRKNIGMAGIMGGADTEVSVKTDSILLESANFDAPTVRRAATAMGHRTEASSRFEKSLDPENTVTGIARFHYLAKKSLPGVQLESTLSDAYPRPNEPKPIRLDVPFAQKFIGKDVSREQMIEILEALEFQCVADGDALKVTPPTFRATKDVEIEADLIEEIARCVGYNSIEPSLPTVSTRHFPESSELVLEEETLDYFCGAGNCNEVHGYIWYDDEWLKQIAIEPGECITLSNPSAENCAKLRRSLVPGLLRFAERNRHHMDSFRIVEIGTAFDPEKDAVETAQHRRLGVLIAKQGKKAAFELWGQMHTLLAGWTGTTFEMTPVYAETDAAHAWEDDARVAVVSLKDREMGRVSVIDPELMNRIDERLKSWAFVVAEIELESICDLLGHHEKLPSVPRFPQVALDFSVLADAGLRFANIREAVDGFDHPLLRRVAFVEAYEGGSVPQGKRSLTLRTQIGHEDRTLEEKEIQEFQERFRKMLTAQKLELRA